MTSERADGPAVVSLGAEDRVRAAEGLLAEWQAWWERSGGRIGVPDNLHVRTAVFLQVSDLLTSVEEEYLTATQVAQLVRVNRRTVNRWINGGKLRAVRVGDRYKVPADAAAAILRPVVEE